MARFRIPMACCLAGVLLAAGTGPVCAGSAYAPTPIGAGQASTPVAHWLIQDSAKAQQDGQAVSSPGYSTQGWYAVSGRATVMAGLLEAGVYDNVFYSDNLGAIQVPDSSGNLFVTPWWYRADFTLDAGAPGRHVLLRSNGIIATGELWVNGHQVAGQGELAGAYPVTTFDVTPWVHAGDNVLALRVYPEDVRKALSIGWVDWNPPPPDNNMGPWRGVDILQTGPVALSDPQVTAVPHLPDLSTATVTVKVAARNLDGIAHDALVSGVVAGVALERRVHLAPGQASVVAFSPQTDPALTLQHPAVWWPLGMGGHPLYEASLQVALDGGGASDRVATGFGVRSVSARLTPQGYRQFLVNGVPVLVRGAGWAPDMFLRDDPARMQSEFAYVVNLGLNTLRTEGKLESDAFYDLADRNGLMVLAGWECCDKWESAAGTGGEPWSEADAAVAEASMASQARLLRNHPSVIGFLIGSDNAPPPAVADRYLRALQAADWPTPVIAAASAQATQQTGPSGMKMAGPYDWVPPSYWYSDRLGGAFGFDSEVSAGADIPRLEDVQRMLSPQEQQALWQSPDVRQYHASAAWSPFAKLTAFDEALARRYGRPTSLADYVAKAQLDNYDNVRAQFEAFNARMDAHNPSTGVIYWMLNNAWPSLHWHLYDYYLNPAGAYFGAKKANEPLHIQYAYDTGQVVLVNHTQSDVHGLSATIRVRGLDGQVCYERRLRNLDGPALRTRQLGAVPAGQGQESVRFVELELVTADGRQASRNVYWLASQPDQLDWGASNWYLTPVTHYADLSALQALVPGPVQVQAQSHGEGSDQVVTVTVSVPANATGTAMFQHVQIRQASDGAPVVPVLWSDNDVTLWPGQTVVLTARYPARDGQAPVVEVSGWNTPAQQVTVAAGQAGNAGIARLH